MDDLERSIIENTPLFVLSSGSTAQEYRRSSIMSRTSNSSTRQSPPPVAQNRQCENGQLDSTSQQARDKPDHHSRQDSYIPQSSQEHRPNEQVENSTAKSPANPSTDTSASQTRRSSAEKENSTDSVYTQKFGIDRPRLVRL
ncbi:hypothetical protein H4S08_001251 [Coemansia sp. RSA 1365]|nr:hypothetical protein H4S08_001251 [Coemansia sp. RSA 1365]